MSPSLGRCPYVVGVLCSFSGTFSRTSWIRCSKNVLWGLCVPSCCSWALIAFVTSVGMIDPQARRLWGLSMTTVYDLLCGHWPHILGLPQWLMVPDKATLWVCHSRANWVVLCCFLKPANGCVGSGVFGKGSSAGQCQMLPVTIQGYQLGVTMWFTACAGPGHVR